MPPPPHTKSVLDQASESKKSVVYPLGIKNDITTGTRNLPKIWSVKSGLSVNNSQKVKYKVYDRYLENKAKKEDVRSESANIKDKNMPRDIEIMI